VTTKGQAHHCKILEPNILQCIVDYAVGFWCKSRIQPEIHRCLHSDYKSGCRGKPSSCCWLFTYIGISYRLWVKGIFVNSCFALSALTWMN